MAINQRDWNVVRSYLSKQASEKLFCRVEQTYFDEEGAEQTKMGFEPVEIDGGVAASFARIEDDVERLVQEVQSLQVSDRELRNALEEPGGAEIQRR